MNNSLKVSQMKVEDIIAYDNNPRLHDSKHISLIKNSIKEFRFTNPVLVDENNVLLAGHGRLLASKEIGLDTIPAIKITYLDEQQKKAYRLADNQLTIKGKWDENLLGMELKDLSELSFDLSITGFEPTEIDLMIDGINAVDDSIEDNVPERHNQPVISKLGDIWQLGKHTIFCGDATDKHSYHELLSDKKATMIFSDPPYNVPINKHVCGLGKVKHPEFAMASGDMTPDEFTAFLEKAFINLRDYSVNGSLHYLCMDWRHISEMTNACNKVYDEFKNLCIWNKNNGGMGSMYRSKHELIFVYKHGKQAHINNIELGKHGRYRTNVWDYDGINSFSRKEESTLHPTIKPVALIADAIKDSTRRNNIVLDAFLGSGSTLIACEQAGRVCYGVEISPLYIDVTIIRWQKYSGAQAINLRTGKTFQDTISGGDHV